MSENEENVKKHSNHKHKKKNILKDYVFINAGFLAIALIFTVVAVLH
ncbi:MAG: hypothetical protein LUG95_06515 [Clostridiales bacterium]|nr:hypothetical protein [Clostridiales bacterium]